MDPMHQFQTKTVIQFLSISNASAYMICITVFLCLFFEFFTKDMKIVPGKIQSLLESVYLLILNTIDDVIGENGKNFLPFVMSLFLFIVSGNLIGLIPEAFTFTTQIGFVLLLSLSIFLSIIFIGIKNHGIGFSSVFIPSGVSFFWKLLLAPIELISYLFRPISLSIRLCANMMAGHIMLKVFANFSSLLIKNLYLVPISILPVCVNTTMMFFEFFVAVLQAYIFMFLTCIYIKDAVYLDH